MNEFIKALVCEGKSPIIPDEQNLYGRFVGEWDFDWNDHLGTPQERHVKGEWIFQWVLEGLAVQDLFICPSRETRLTDPQPDAAYASTMRMYNPNKQAWDILYTEWGCATCLEGYWKDGMIVQSAVGNDRLRWVFSEITPDSFRWQRMVLKDGENWVMEADLHATRRK